MIAINKKPVPLVESLRYKGTTQKPDIKIFVSHRIDLDSETIDNPLYIPVRCGAVYDERTPEKIGEILGDDTGDNISEKRESFCELTVHYWAWKNVQADYYGLCHYRRYISFKNIAADVGVAEKNNGCVTIDWLNKPSIDRCGLTEEIMKKEIEQYDIIAMNPIILDQHIKSNYHAMQLSPDYHNMKDVDNAIRIVKKKYPYMAHAVDKYMFSSRESWLYNCFIMKSNVFNEYSSFLFDVLDELEKCVDSTFYSQQMNRTPGTIAERLLGIFYTYVLEKSKYKIKYNRLVFFDNTEKYCTVKPYFSENNIAIASNFNNNYVPMFSVFLSSLIQFTNHQNNYDILILSKDITEKNKNILKSMVKHFDNIIIRFINPEIFLADSSCSFYVGNNIYTEDMYYRVFIPQILASYSKILVVDADMIVQHDIAEIYNIDLTGYMAGAVRDVVFQGYLNGRVPGTKEYTVKELGLINPYNYCNTGVLLYNCELYRKKYSLKYLMEFISAHKFRIYEQDALNVLLDGKMRFLDERYNTYTYTNNGIYECVLFAPADAKKKYIEARKDPVIVHYAGHPKPATTIEGDYGVVFWEFARKTPYYELILSKALKETLGKLTPVNTMYQPPEDNRSGARKLADKLLPHGSFRRRLLKWFLPKGSLQWRFFKQIYYIFRPEYRHVKVK